MTDIDHTHDPALKSFIASANRPGCDFPIQNLPYGAFRRHSTGAPRIGVAIGDDILDIAAVGDLLDGAAWHAAAACAAAHLNDLMKLGPTFWAALRAGLSQLLSTADADRQSRVEHSLTPIAAAEFFVPVQIPNFTDFFASIFHATNTGRLFRPDNPLMPNYKYVPVAYHGRASSVRVSGVPVRRPSGQTKRREDTTPVYRPARSLDYELELGFYVGRPSTLGTPVPISEAG